MLKNRTKIFLGSRIAAEGFTLAELIIASAIMSVVFAGILVSYIRCMELNEASLNKSMATKAARSRMELIKGSDYDTLLGSYHELSFVVSGFTGMGVSYVTVLDAKNTRVVVSVSWRQKNGRVYGEDKNLNGVLDAGEDLNGDSMLNSPVDVTARIFKRT